MAAETGCRPEIKQAGSSGRYLKRPSSTSLLVTLLLFSAAMLLHHFAVTERKAETHLTLRITQLITVCCVNIYPVYTCFRVPLCAINAQRLKQADKLLSKCADFNQIMALPLTISNKIIDVVHLNAHSTSGDVKKTETARIHRGYILLLGSNYVFFLFKWADNGPHY